MSFGKRVAFGRKRQNSVIVSADGLFANRHADDVHQNFTLSAPWVGLANY